jgi:Ca2+:H+ antiporter
LRLDPLEGETRVTSNDSLAPASEAPAPRGLAPSLRAEWFFLVSLASVAAFALFEDRIFSRLGNPLSLTAILLWLFGVVLWSSLSVVRHAESLARRLGEPYGTLLLTLTITSIEVVAISAVVRHGGPNPTLMRDTLLAVIMIIMNGMVGVTLLISGVKHREQTFNLQGANAYLSVLLPLATFAPIMPDYTQTTPGPIHHNCPSHAGRTGFPLEWKLWCRWQTAQRVRVTQPPHRHWPIRGSSW